MHAPIRRALQSVLDELGVHGIQIAHRVTQETQLVLVLVGMHACMHASGRPGDAHMHVAPAHIVVQLARAHELLLRCVPEGIACRPTAHRAQPGCQTCMHVVVWRGMAYVEASSPSA